MTRRESRKQAFCLVFQLPVNELSYEELVETAAEDEELEMDEFCLSILKHTLDNRIQIDAQIDPFLKKWTLSRLPRVSLAVLRVSCAQLMFMQDIPDSVVINEAVELAKEFGAPEEYAFVNGTLRSINNALKEQRGEAPAE